MCRPRLHLRPFAIVVATPPSLRTGKSPTTSNKNTTQANSQITETRGRYPPLVVESLPNWAYHFRQLKEKLGCAPHARPSGRAVRFTPKEESKYRTIQRYLTDLEKAEPMSWFYYSLPPGRSVKVTIRGLPAVTDIQDISQELADKGHEIE